MQLEPFIQSGKLVVSHLIVVVIDGGNVDVEQHVELRQRRVPRSERRLHQRLLDIGVRDKEQ